MPAAGRACRRPIAAGPERRGPSTARHRTAVPPAAPRSRIPGARAAPGPAGAALRPPMSCRATMGTDPTTSGSGPRVRTPRPARCPPSRATPPAPLPVRRPARRLHGARQSAPASKGPGRPSPADGPGIPEAGASCRHRSCPRRERDPLRRVARVPRLAPARETRAPVPRAGERAASAQPGPRHPSPPRARAVAVPASRAPAPGRPPRALAPAGRPLPPPAPHRRPTGTPRLTTPTRPLHEGRHRAVGGPTDARPRNALRISGLAPAFPPRG